MNIGYIYKITNNRNGKVYIGQTSKTIEQRWKEHINDSKRKNRTKFALQLAIIKYGEENFSIEKIEECDIYELDKKEIYWISYYDSFHNGYNETLGGNGSKKIELDEIDVINTYNKMQNLRKVSEMFSCNPATIVKILKKHNIKILSFQDVLASKGNHIEQYDLNGNLIHSFFTRKEVGEWIIENGYSSSNNPTYAGEIIRRRFEKFDEFKLYGYIWKIKNPYLDKEKYLYHKDDYTYLKYLQKKEKVNNRCIICNNLIDYNSTLCRSCENKKKKLKAIQEREEKYGITREILKQEIRNIPFIKLGEKYNVSDNTIRKWCKSYNLPYKSSEIKSYSDEEWKKL